MNRSTGASAVSWAHFRQVIEAFTREASTRMLGSSECIAALERRIAALEARPTMRYRGVWSAEQPYNEGEFCTDHGSIFYCRTATRARPGTSADWQLAVKRGSDAR